MQMPGPWGEALDRLVAWSLAGLDRLPASWRSRVAERDLPWLVLGVVAGTGCVLAVAATAASAELYDGVEDGDGIAAVDRPILDRVLGWRTPELDAAVTAFTDLGSAQVMVPLMVGAAGLLWWWWRRPTPAVLLAVAAAGALLMTVVGKHVIGRARPPHELAVPPFEASPSFPSGHTLHSWVLWILLAYLVSVRAGSRRVAVGATATAVVLAVGMGLSRVYLGHHWFTDVLVGWTLGTAWLAVVVTGHRLAASVRRSTRRPVTADAAAPLPRRPLR